MHAGQMPHHPALMIAAGSSGIGGPSSPFTTLSSHSHSRPSPGTDRRSLDHSLDFPLSPASGAMMARSSSFSTSHSQASTPLSSKHKRSESLDQPAPPLPPLPAAAQAFPVRYGPYGQPSRLMTPLPGLNRAAPEALSSASISSAALVGGDMMLSPFGLEGTPSPAAIAFGRFPAILAPARLAPTGASRSVGDLLTMTPHPSETVSSLGDKPRVKVYNEFGVIQQASQSAPTLFGGRAQSVPSGEGSGSTQDSHGHSHEHHASEPGSSEFAPSMSFSSHEMHPGGPPRPDDEQAAWALRSQWDTSIWETNPNLQLMPMPTRSPHLGGPEPGPSAGAQRDSGGSIQSTPSAPPTSSMGHAEQLRTPPSVPGGTPSRREMREALREQISFDDSSDDGMGAAPAAPERRGLFWWMRR